MAGMAKPIIWMSMPSQMMGSAARLTVAFWSVPQGLESSRVSMFVVLAG